MRSRGKGSDIEASCEMNPPCELILSRTGGFYSFSLSKHCPRDTRCLKAQREFATQFLRHCSSEKSENICDSGGLFIHLFLV